MSKPFSIKGAGNGGHFNFSLWAPEGGAPAAAPAATTAGGFVSGPGGFSSEGLRNVLHDASAPHGLSRLGRHFLAGVLAHAPALEALCSPTVPCYARHGNWAPTHATWGVDDRLAAVRLKRGSTGPHDAFFEVRAGAPYGAQTCRPHPGRRRVWGVARTPCMPPSPLKARPVACAPCMPPPPREGGPLGAHG